MLKGSGASGSGILEHKASDILKLQDSRTALGTLKFQDSEAIGF